MTFVCCWMIFFWFSMTFLWFWLLFLCFTIVIEIIFFICPYDYHWFYLMFINLFWLSLLFCMMWPRNELQNRPYWYLSHLYMHLFRWLNIWVLTPILDFIKVFRHPPDFINFVLNYILPNNISTYMKILYTCHINSNCIFWIIYSMSVLSLCCNLLLKYM